MVLGLVRTVRVLNEMLRHNEARTMSAEQKARDMLERMGVENAQDFSAGELVELANLIAQFEMMRSAIEEAESVLRSAGCDMTADACRRALIS